MEVLSLKVKPRVKVWLEADGKSVIGKGGADLLAMILSEGNLKVAAEKLGVSYKYAWSYLKKVEETLGMKVVSSARGGSKRGKTILTDAGRRLLVKYMRFKKFVDKALENSELWEACGLSISDKNVVPGRIKEVTVNGLAALVKVKVGRPLEMVAAISSASADELGLKLGDKVTIIIKATEVLISKKEAV